MKLHDRSPADVREYRNSRLYRSLGRILRVYTRRLIADLHARGFEDFAPSFPQVLSNLDTVGTRVGVLAARAGITRQAAGQLLADIERCGYVSRRPAPDDARAVIVLFTPRGRRLLETILELVGTVESEFAEIVGRDEFERIRTGLARIANTIDPNGVFGDGDEEATPPRRRGNALPRHQRPKRGRAPRA
jgi:DNA-binding MarR family transcriptional regulator